MKTRTIKELLQVMLDNQDLFYNGLCGWCISLCKRDFINYQEHHVLNKFIIKNRITNTLSIQDFWYKQNKKSSFYWKWDKITPRIHWIKYQIKQLEKQEKLC